MGQVSQASRKKVADAVVQVLYKGNIQSLKTQGCPITIVYATSDFFLNCKGQDNVVPGQL